ncbi:MAG: 6-phosphofructokinase [Dehalococcoidia bacterium]
MNGAVHKIAVLSSGGDAPGMNACIRAIVRTASGSGIEVVGVLHGYRGLLEGLAVPLTRRAVGNIIQRGGTILGTARCEAFTTPEGRAEAAQTLREAEIDGLVVLGGDGSFRGAAALASEHGLPVITIPATIDNDIVGTDFTVGFDTAVNVALEAIDRIRDTAESLERLFFVEVMGHVCGAIALEVGVAGGADEMLVPEAPVDIDVLCERLQEGFRHGRRSSIVVVAEGKQPGETFAIAHEVWTRTHVDHRVCVLGHVQRGGAPTARDRVLGSKLGTFAVDALAAGHSAIMVGEVAGRVCLTPLEQVLSQHRGADYSLLDLARRLTH